MCVLVKELLPTSIVLTTLGHAGNYSLIFWQINKPLSTGTSWLRKEEFSSILVKANPISLSLKQAQSARSLIPHLKERRTSLAKPLSSVLPRKLGSLNPESSKIMEQLVYIIQFDSHIIYYSVRTGKMSVQK